MLRTLFYLVAEDEGFAWAMSQLTANSIILKLARGEECDVPYVLYVQDERIKRLIDGMAKCRVIHESCYSVNQDLVLIRTIKVVR